MESRSIGELKVSLAGLGCNNFGGRLERAESIAVVHAAMDAGITFFDTADIYSSGRSEEHLGAAIAGRRDEVIIGTKFGNPFDGEPAGAGAGADWIRTAVEGSLRRLGTDHIDLFQQHVPDPTVPIEETHQVLDELVRSGKVRAIGNSNFSAAQIDAAEALATDRGWARFVCAQNRFNLIDRGPLDDVIPACARDGLAFLPFFPLAAGMLTGKYERGRPLPDGSRLASLPPERAASFASERNYTLVEALTAVAADRGHSLLELAVAWLAAQPTVASVISGATTPQQVRANVAALDWTLTADDLAAVDAALAAVDEPA